MKRQIFALLAALPSLAVFSIDGFAGPEPDSSPQLVEPKVPISFILSREGGESQGAFETEEGREKAIRLEEGDISWEIVLTWTDGKLAGIEKAGENPTLGRSIETEISLERGEGGRIQSQKVRSRGMTLYEIRYSYGSSHVPQNATVFSGANEPIERLRYEYGHKAWSRPLYLFSGLHFGQVRTYSDHGAEAGEMALFAVASYTDDDWKIESLTMPVSEPSHTETQRFNYDPVE